MATINNLIPDIQAMLESGKFELDNKLLAAHLGDVGKAMRKHVLVDSRSPRPDKTLYASELGKPCKRELWFKIHRPELAGKLNGAAKFKFMYGDMIESIALWLAKEAGHSVTNQQEPVEIALDGGWVVRGRIDAVVDGVLIDVKSASSPAMTKFRSGLTDKNDAFGYRSQLGVYLTGVQSKGLTSEDYAGFLAIDKTTGEMILSGYASSNLRYELPSSTLDALENKHANGFDRLTPNGNVVPMPCRYCAFVATCWPHAKVSMVNGRQSLITGE